MSESARRAGSRIAIDAVVGGILDYTIFEILWLTLKPRSIEEYRKRDFEQIWIGLSTTPADSRYISKTSTSPPYPSLLLLLRASRSIALHQAPVAGDMITPDGAEALDVAAPVAVQLRGDGGPVEQLHAVLGEPLVGRLARVLGKGAARVRHDEHVVPFLGKRQRREGRAHLGQDAAVNHHTDVSVTHRRIYLVNQRDETYLMITCFLPAFSMAPAKSSLSMALIWPGRRMRGASGSSSWISLAMGPFGPVSNEVVRIEGALKYFATLTSARTLLRNSSAPKSRTSWMSPDYVHMYQSSSI